MSAWKGEWENAISGKQMDSVRKETLAASATEIIVDNEHNRPLLLRMRRHRLTEESLQKALAPVEKEDLRQESPQRSEFFWKERSECVHKSPPRKLHESVV